MKGKILDFKADTGAGVISAEDGQRYSFTAAQWQADTDIRAGVAVDFVPAGAQAEAIYVDTALVSGSSKKVAAALFAFFFGVFGVHKFYLGYTKQGVIMVLAFVFGFILLGLPSLVVAIIAFIEFIIYITKSDAEFEQSYVLNQRPWF
ncbi:MAG: TM2 domain-containing membrane protein YozV [Zhongshania aliphaticivorans]|jgi:TM2 domain-containing membrane protein YozV